MTTQSVPGVNDAIGADQTRYDICLIHPFDPRGSKVGGLETYIRDFITFHPRDANLLVIGVDGRGDLTPGRVQSLTFRGRDFDFLPILRFDDARTSEAARTIRESITARFFVAILRNFSTIVREVRDRRCSIDLRRVEFAWLPVLLRAPFVQMLHGEGAPKLRMDSLLRKHRYVHNVSERFARATSAKFLCVNPLITERMRATYPRHRAKIDTLWTWANTDIFRPQPFPVTGAFRIVFAGRLDQSKNPSLMFKTVDRLRRVVAGLEFHYIGTSNPHRYPEFAAIEDITTRHGFQDAKGTAATLASAHAGILTSTFEGLPRSVLETLAVGRPVVAVHLPQLEFAIRDGVNGYLCRADCGEDRLVDRLVARFAAMREAIAGGAVDPVTVAAQIKMFTPDVQLARVYRLHRDIQDRRGGSAGNLFCEDHA
jgi:glycosyltransferase involved in cell wall biosynthesis